MTHSVNLSQVQAAIDLRHSKSEAPDKKLPPLLSPKQISLPDYSRLSFNGFL
jgi:hypothetical protein